MPSCRCCGSRRSPISSTRTSASGLCGSARCCSARSAALRCLLAIVGVYGVKAYAVARRTREIGIRMALGAHPKDVFKLIMKQGALQTALAVRVGVMLALAIGQVLAGMLFQVSPMDPAALASSASAAARDARACSPASSPRVAHEGQPDDGDSGREIRLVHPRADAGLTNPFADQRAHAAAHGIVVEARAERFGDGVGDRFDVGVALLQRDRERRSLHQAFRRVSCGRADGGQIDRPHGDVLEARSPPCQRCSWSRRAG